MQSMRLCLTDAIHNVDIKHYWSTFVYHDSAVWITCQHNMHAVPVQPNQQWSSEDRVSNTGAERESRRCVWTWGLALSPAQGPIDLIGGWWHWLSSGAKWIRSLTQWAQERDGPPPAPGSRLVASCQAALSPGSFFFPLGEWGVTFL